MDTFEYDAEGMPENTGYEPVPNGTYTLRIENVESRFSKRGYQQYVVDYVLIDNPEYEGRKIKYHYITVIPKDMPGAGLFIHFLKSIGEPYKDRFTVDPNRWIGRKVQAYVVVEEYQGKKNNKVNYVDPPESGQNQDEDSEVPF